MTDLTFGTVYLVGAGPGDPELLTVKANRLLKSCDALVYDSLVPKELLDLVPENCQTYFVGKRRGHHSVPQGRTNQILCEMAQSKSIIVRLKGGDPFVFGRGAEEAAYLIGKGVPVQVVPGITSGIAVPAYLGIPVTHRLAGSSVTFVTGHEGIDKRRPAVNWKGLATSTDTLVIYMGVHNLDTISEELIKGGLDPSTPAIVIQQGTVIGQRFIKEPLSKIAIKAQSEQYTSPAIVMIGKAIEFQVFDSAPDPADVTMPIPF